MANASQFWIYFSNYHHLYKTVFSCMFPICKHPAYPLPKDKQGDNFVNNAVFTGYFINKISFKSQRSVV